jgi:hypothetical protein
METAVIAMIAAVDPMSSGLNLEVRIACQAYRLAVGVAIPLTNFF